MSLLVCVSATHCEPMPCMRQVREALTLLDLDVLIYPCPKGGPTYRPKATQMSGKAQFPFLVDPNTGSSFSERTQNCLNSQQILRQRSALLDADAR